MKINKHTLCEKCPVNTCNGASHYALKAIEAVQNNEPENGAMCCPFYINSKAYGYCFWKFLDNECDTMSIQDIATLLCITPAEVKSALDSAIKKIRNGFESNNPEIVDFIDLMRSRVQINNNISEFAELNDEILQQITDQKEEAVADEDIKKRGRPKRTPLDMPLHRSGKKVDIYGLYSKKSLIRHHREKNESKKNKPE